jgi:hypothetical protein
MDNHPNSTEALKTCADTLNKRQKAIFYHLFYSGPATDREVKEKLGYTDMNQVRPRITELLRAGLAIEVSETVCPTTGQTVRVVAAVKPPTQSVPTYAATDTNINN